MTDRRGREPRDEARRLSLRVEELNTALKLKHQEFLDMLDRLQEREEDAVRRALGQLSRSEQRVAVILEAAAEGILGLDANGHIVFVNPAAGRLLGCSPEELRGRSAHEAIHSGAGDAPAHGPSECPVTMTLEDGRTRREEGDLFRTPDGEAVTVEYSATPILEDGRIAGAVISFRDVGDRIRQQRAIEETTAELEETVIELRTRTRDAEAARAAAEKAERRMAFLAEASEILSATLDYDTTLRRLAELGVRSLADWAIVDVADRDGGIRRLAVAAADPDHAGHAKDYQRRFPPDPTSPHGVAQVLRTGRPQLIPEVTDAALKRTARSSEQLRILRATGLRSVMIVPLKARGRVVGSILFGSTSDDRSYDEDDLALAMDLAGRAALAVDNARLYEAELGASRAKSEFLAVMSHELRTPLNAVLGYSDLLLAGVPVEIPGEAHEQVDRVRAAAQHLLQIIEEILTFSRVEAGQETLQASDFDLVPVLRDVADLVHPLAKDKGLRFRIEVPDDPGVVRTDERKLRQILLNLLSNAIKFTDEGEVVVRVGPRDPEGIGIAVRDTGTGIAPADQARIFEPFSQLEQGTTRQVGGTGLGLSVARQLAVIMGGELVLDSEPGRGSTFMLTLPDSAP